MLKKIFILFLIGSWATTFAQEPLRYTTQQGLPSNHIYDIAEDENGFMWFATKQGLVKYDGETFKTLTIQNGLPNNDTWHIETDLKGRLWYFAKSAYQGYIKNDSIYKFATKNKQVVSPRYFYKSKDSIWFITNLGIQTVKNQNIVDAVFYNQNSLAFINNEISKINKQKGLNDHTRLEVVYNPEIKEYAFISKNEILFYTKDFQFIKELKIDIPLRDYYERVYDKQGLFYNHLGFYALEKGILFFNFKTYQAIYKSFQELVGVQETGYIKCRGLKNEIQISIPGHLMIFDYNLNLKNTHTFPKQLSQSSYKDSKGNIWLSDLANGVSLVPNSQIQTQYYLPNHKVQKINSIQGDFYAGANVSGFFKFNKISNTFVNLNPNKKPHTEIYQIKEDPSTRQNYFLAANKTFTLHKSFFNEINFYSPDPAAPNTKLGGLKDIIYHNDINYIVTSGYLVLNKPGSSSTSKHTLKSGLLSAEVYNNKVFVAGSDGLFQVEKDTLIKPKLNSELMDVSVSSLTTSKDFLLVGTDGRGVYLYTNKAIFHLKETDGLSVQRILKKDSFLWLATQKGVKKVFLDVKILTNSKIIDAYFDADGLLQNNTNDIYIKNNFLYAASDVGLAKINLESSIYKHQPKLYFKTINDTIQYKNEERDNISISFALQDFVNQNYTTFEYRLLPFQKNWQKTETKILNFSNLAPELYQLEVRATNQHNITSTKRQFLNVIPKWWQTTFAKICFTLLVFLFLFIIFLLTKKQIRKKEQAKAQQEKRVAGLELQALRSQMNPHFVHNSLNAIQYFIQRNEVELSENYLSKFSQLIRLFFEYSRRQTITIKEELELLNNYLEIEKLRFEDKLTYNIKVCEAIDTEEQLIPSMLLQPIVENAVNHGLFHKKENGTIDVEFKQLDKDTYQVIVKDDGIGVNKSKIMFKHSSKNYQSNSSAVLQERLELLNKSNEWNISYSIKDISEIDTTKTGTLVILIFKQLHNL